MAWTGSTWLLLLFCAPFGLAKTSQFQEHKTVALTRPSNRKLSREPWKSVAKKENKMISLALAHVATVAVLTGTQVPGSQGTHSLALNTRGGRKESGACNSLIAVQKAKLLPSDGGMGDQFGGRLSVSGNTIVLGASVHNNHAGAAYVFLRTGSSFVEQAKLAACDVVPFNEFGLGVAISGETVVVGARQDVIGHRGKGAAYVFERTGTVWNSRAKLVASDGSINDAFGQAVAIDGDTVIVGAHDDDDGGTDSGSAYVFVKPLAGWGSGCELLNETAKLTASSTVSSARFGFSVSISENTVFVGAYGDDHAGSHSGAAYVFEKPASGWEDSTEDFKLTASDAAALDEFGIRLAVSGEQAVVGARYDSDGEMNAGSAYIFEKSGTLWGPHETVKVTASDAEAGDLLGTFVAISGDTIMLGSIGDDDACPSDPGCNSGSAYVFRRCGSTWREEAKLAANDASQGEAFGGDVGVFGNVVVVGAVPASPNVTGSAYVFALQDLGTNNPDRESPLKILAQPLSQTSAGGLTLSAKGLDPGETTVFIGGTDATWHRRLRGCTGVATVLSTPKLLGVQRADSTGEAVLEVPVRFPEQVLPRLVQAVAPDSCRTSDPIRVPIPW